MANDGEEFVLIGYGLDARIVPRFVDCPYGRVGALLQCVDHREPPVPLYMAYLTRFSLNVPLRSKYPIRAALVYTFRWFIALASQFVPGILRIAHFSVSRNGYRLRVVPTPFSCFLYRFPDEYRDDEEFLQAYLKEGDTYIDIGANIGTTTLAAAVSVGATGKVYSFEAHPRVYSYLIESVEENPSLKSRITTYPYALGNEEGEVHFTDLRKDDVNHVEDDGTIRVPLKTLDVVMADQESRITLLKIDVEGYEKYVLQGASRVLDMTDAVYFESFDTNYATYGYTVADVIEILQNHHFKVFALSHDLKVIPIDSSYRSPICENLMALRDEATFAKRMQG